MMVMMIALPELLHIIIHIFLWMEYLDYQKHTSLPSWERTSTPIGTLMNFLMEESFMRNMEKHLVENLLLLFTICLHTVWMPGNVHLLNLCNIIRLFYMKHGM